MTARVVVIGRNSAVWKRLREHASSWTESALAIGHSEVADAPISYQDKVWILSYSRDAEDNRALLARLKEKGAASYHYVSTATANVAELTRCFGYPRAKAEAEADARRLLNAEIVRVGIVYGDESELPGGCNAATSLGEIATAMFGLPQAPAARRDLFRMIDRPFRSGVESMLYRGYGALLEASGAFPCLLRPLDLLLRAAGMRWYGYLYLSNRLLLRDRAGPAQA